MYMLAAFPTYYITPGNASAPSVFFTAWLLLAYRDHVLYMVFQITTANGRFRSGTGSQVN